MIRCCLIVLVSLCSYPLLVAQEATVSENELSNDTLSTDTTTTRLDECFDCYPFDSLFSPNKGQPDKCETCDKNNIVRKRLDLRKRNLDFHETLRSIHPPSQVSGGGLTSIPINTLGYRKKNYILDANVQFPIAIGGKRFGLNSIHVIPQFKVRIFQDDPDVPFGTNGDESLPVRTPSTIPGAVYYWSFNKLWHPNNHFSRSTLKEFKKDGLDKPDWMRNSHYFGFYAFHHSNGQDGPQIAPNDSVNIYNGNYGEQVVFELIWGMYRKNIGDGSVFDQNLKKKKEHLQNQFPGEEAFVKTQNRVLFSMRSGMEWHPYGLSDPVFRDVSNLGLYPERAHMIGRLRLNTRFVWQFVPKLAEFIKNCKEEFCLITPPENYERLRLMADISFILDNNYYRGPNMNELERIGLLGLHRRLNIAASAYYVLKRSKNAAVFGEINYAGSDRYNIYFNQSLFQIKFGLAFGFFNQPENPDANF